jgi:hypothetical protein
MSLSMVDGNLASLLPLSHLKKRKRHVDIGVIQANMAALWSLVIRVVGISAKVDPAGNPSASSSAFWFCGGVPSSFYGWMVAHEINLSSPRSGTKYV